MTRGKRCGGQAGSGALEHIGSEVECDHGLESLGEVGQQRACAAAKVGRGLPPIGGDFLQSVPERIGDLGPVRVEKNLVVASLLAVPVFCLFLNGFFGQGRIEPLAGRLAGRAVIVNTGVQFWSLVRESGRDGSNHDFSGFAAVGMRVSLRTSIRALAVAVPMMSR